MSKSVAVLLDEINAKKKIHNKDITIKIHGPRYLILNILKDVRVNEIVDLQPLLYMKPYELGIALTRILNRLNLTSEQLDKRKYKILSNEPNCNVLIGDLIPHVFKIEEYVEK